MNQQEHASVGSQRIVGESPAFRAAMTTLDRIKCSEAPVLIEGETGCGKEVAARAIHYGGPRSAAPFVPLNCGALPDLLFESELFGHERGAFTDARERRRGLVAEADGGTLFLDEVDALSPKAQVALLRFLQDQRFRPLGSTREQHCDLRLIAACNRPLAALAAAGTFRQDLLYRLDVLHLGLPPLRERSGDAALLARHFAERFARKYGGATKTFDAPTLAWMAHYAWPGNIRELENWVHREVLMGDGPVIRAAGAARADPDPGRAPLAPTSYRDARARALEEFEREFLLRALEATRGNVSNAALLVGKERRAFGKLLKKHAIDRAAIGR
ncbi:MAG: sigma-54-dependent Fis family transcriptional regulator [Burkholderiales bacterium]|nr:sigma-54-dependent Fis family transcriptional regulator [Burkholderiales bacterium]